MNWFDKYKIALKDKDISSSDEILGFNSVESLDRPNSGKKQVQLNVSEKE